MKDEYGDRKNEKTKASKKASDYGSMWRGGLPKKERLSEKWDFASDW
jgi:hypothetical protein